MKLGRLVLVALFVSITAAALLMARARTSGATSACGPGVFWSYCVCRQITCSSGPQLCAQGAGFTCFQQGVKYQ